MRLTIYETHWQVDGDGALPPVVVVESGVAIPFRSCGTLQSKMRVGLAEAAVELGRLLICWVWCDLRFWHPFRVQTVGWTFSGDVAPLNPRLISGTAARCGPGEEDEEDEKDSHHLTIYDQRYTNKNQAAAGGRRRVWFARGRRKVLCCAL